MLIAAVTSSDAASCLRDYFFGDTLISASVSLSGAAKAIATARLDAWGYAQTGYTLALGGTSRAAVLFDQQDSNTAVRLQLADPDDKVLAMVRASLDGRNGFAAGVMLGSDIDASLTGTDYYLVLFRVQESKPIDEDVGVSTRYVVATGASDLPASSWAVVNVNARVAANQQYTIDMRLTNDVIEVRLNDEATASIKFNSNVTYAPEADTASFGTSSTGRFSTRDSCRRWMVRVCCRRRSTR